MAQLKSDEELMKNIQIREDKMCYGKTFFHNRKKKKSKFFCLHQKTIAGAFFFFVLVSEAYVLLEK